jgi:hypothetical protein
MPCDRLATLSFGQRPTLLHLTAVLGVVHQHAPCYDLYRHQCYWFADTIWGILSSTRYQPILKLEEKASVKLHLADTSGLSEGV